MYVSTCILLYYFNIYSVHVLLYILYYFIVYMYILGNSFLGHSGSGVVPIMGLEQEEGTNETFRKRTSPRKKHG